MNRGWPLLGLSTLFGAGAVVAGVAGLSFPPLWLLALALGAGSYGCWSEARERIVGGVYRRIGVEPNDDGTVGEAGARAERTATGRVEYEPRDDWDDPDDWPFDGPFWTDEDVDGSAAGGSATGGDGSGPTGRTAGGRTGDGRTATDRTSFGERTRGGRAGGRYTGGGSAVAGVSVAAPRTREACDVLGVDVDATDEEVRAAYRERVKEVHPDRGGDEETFKRVRWAYEYLRDDRN